MLQSQIFCLLNDEKVHIFISENVRVFDVKRIPVKYGKLKDFYFLLEMFSSVEYYYYYLFVFLFFF